MEFASRQDGGRRLAGRLRELGFHADVVLGLPRGGVVVAAEVADALHCPLDTIIVRKIGHPLQREFAVGALAEGDVVLLHERHIGNDPLLRHRLESVIAEEKDRLAAYRKKFHPAKQDLNGKVVLIVDDGIATGSTAEAAIISAKHQGAKRVIIAAPVASTEAFNKLQAAADDVVVLVVDPDFMAVGQYYADFSETSDDEVRDLLQSGKNFHAKTV